MGIWDNVKDRLGLGGGGSDADRGYDGYQYGFDDENYDADYEDDGEYVEQPASMRRFGVDRADYYNDNHSPLVSQVDVRSQPVPMNSAAAPTRDRIPAPQPYRRGTNLPSLGVDDNEYAFKSGLARTPGSLSQMQIERLRLENTGRFKTVEEASESAEPATQYGQPQPRVTERASNVVEATARFGQNQVRQRATRRIERIRPVNYADAEQVAQALKGGVIVLLDLRATRPDLAKRILDFSFGAASVLEGQVDRHVDRVYIFTCNGPLTEEEKASLHV
jgi:cell division inhibitor SepF